MGEQHDVASVCLSGYCLVGSVPALVEGGPDWDGGLLCGDVGFVVSTVPVGGRLTQSYLQEVRDDPG
jgi:hypothetical protein